MRRTIEVLLLVLLWVLVPWLQQQHKGRVLMCLSNFIVCPLIFDDKTAGKLFGCFLLNYVLFYPLLQYG